MATTDSNDLKLYYSIKEVAAMFGVTPSTLRYWEKEFPQIHPTTNARGVRQYTKENIDVIRVVHTQVKVRGFKLEAVKKMLATNRSGTEQNSKVLALLRSVRDEMRAIKKQLDTLQ